MLDKNILEKLSNINVLIIEDDETISFALEQALSLHCKKVYVANDGLDGFELFEKNKPDVVISDINLPGLNGLEIVKLIHDISPHVPVIIMTSYDSQENMMKSINQKVYSYLRKPVSIVEIQTALLLSTRNIYDSVINLACDFHYNKDEKQLYNSNNTPIVFTKLESRLLHLLLCNINKIVDYSTIENYVWEDNDMSIDALRMRVKNIRSKTYADIIENVSGIGYRINNQHLIKSQK